MINNDNEMILGTIADEKGSLSTNRVITLIRIALRNAILEDLYEQYGLVNNNVHGLKMQL